jgi:hypothetical protein
MMDITFGSECKHKNDSCIIIFDGLTIDGDVSACRLTSSKSFTICSPFERETFMSKSVHIADHMTARSAAAGRVLVRLCSLISWSDKRLA